MEAMSCVLSAYKLRWLVAAMGLGAVLCLAATGVYYHSDSSLSSSVTRNENGLEEPAVVGQNELSATTTHLLLRTSAGVRNRRLRSSLETAAGKNKTLSSAGSHGLLLDDVQQSPEADGGSGGDGFDPDDEQCSDVHKQTNVSRRCTFVKVVDSCQNDGGILNYLQFVYCVIPYKLIPLAMVVLFIWLIFLFIFLGVTAEEYFCPALTIMSKILHLGHNVAGVTLLAFGNGAPDIFSAFAAISQNDDRKSSLAIGALFGAGMFVSTVVVGGVSFLSHFTLTKRPFLRDITFYVFAVFWTFFLLWTNTVNIYMAAGFVAMYVFYVVVVIVGRIIYQRWKVKAQKREMAETMLGSPSTTPALPTSIPNGPDVLREDGAETDTESESEVVHRRLETISGSEDNSGEAKTKVYQGASLQVTTDDGVTDQNLRIPRSKRRSHSHPTRPPNRRPKEKKLHGTRGALFQQFGAFLAVPAALDEEARRAKSPTAIEEGGWRYAERRRTTWYEDDRRPRTSSPRTLRVKNLPGALDVSEEVLAAVGLPHDTLWPVHRSKNSPLIASRRSHRSGSGRESNRSGEATQIREEEEEEGETADENTPLILQKPKKVNVLLTSLRLFLSALFPFGSDFRELGIPGKIYEILKYPCGLILTLTVPVIDTEAELNNWNKWLNVLHCITGPMAVALLTKVGFKEIGGVFPVWALVLIVGILLAVIVACTSWSNHIPIYHCVFAWLGFVIAVVWIYAIANEIVNLLQTFGVVVKLSDGILGITLLAWGNSIGDAVANLTMARQGFPRMAIGACYGGPLLNILIGVGVSSLYKSIKRESDGFKFKLYFTQVEFFAAVFLLTTLALSMAIISLSRYRVYRLFALLLIGIYATFLVVAILAEIPVFDIDISGVITH